MAEYLRRNGIRPWKRIVKTLNRSLSLRSVKKIGYHGSVPREFYGEGWREADRHTGGLGARGIRVPVRSSVALSVSISLSFHFFFLSLLTFIFPDCISRLFRASQHRPARISRSVDTDRSPPSLPSDAKRAGNVIYVYLFADKSNGTLLREPPSFPHPHSPPLFLFFVHFPSIYFQTDWLARS